MLSLRQGRGRLDDVLGEANHGGGLVHADGLGHALFGKKAGGHAGPATDVQDSHLGHGGRLGPFLEEEGTFALEECIVLEDFIVDGGVRVVVDEFVGEPTVAVAAAVAAATLFVLKPFKLWQGT